MATAANSKAEVGTVKVVIGDVKVIGVDGVARQVQVGDKVYAKETIQTAANAVVQVQLENGRMLDLGRDSKIALDDDILTAGAGPSTTPAPATGDIAAIQAQIAAGADPSKVAEATAAGGAPGAGGADGSGSTPVYIDQANSTGEVTSGFSTGPAGIGFPDIPPGVLPVIEPVDLPLVSVSVSVTVTIDSGGSNGGGGTPGDPGGGVLPVQDDGLIVSGNLASLVEGTSDEGSRLVIFEIKLDQAFSQPVQVTFVIDGGTATPLVDYTPEDLAQYTLTAEGYQRTVTIAPGETSFFVNIIIAEDSDIELDETFTITLTDAVNATIGPDNVATAIIVDDDFRSVAIDETKGVQGDANDVAAPSATITNVYGSTTLGGANSGGGSEGSNNPDISQKQLTTLSGDFFTGQSSGLITTEGDKAINLYSEGVNGKFVVGRYDADGSEENGDEAVAFVVTLEADGSTSVVQYAAIDHGQDGNNPDSSLSINLYVTTTVTLAGVTESPTSTTPLVVSFQDDGPTVDLTDEDGPVVEVDETTLGVSGAASGDFSGLFTSDAGADGEADSDPTDYSLSVVDGTDSGVVQTSTGDAVLLYMNETTGEVEGRNDADQVVFTISIDDDGILTLTQFSAVMHDSADEGDISEGVYLAGDVLTITKTVEDKDGDTASNSATVGADTIGFLDDGPSVVVAPNAVLTNSITAVLTASVNVDYGTDGGALALTGYSEGADGVIQGTYVNNDGDTVTFNLTYGGDTLTYNQIDDTHWVAETEDGTDVFSIELDSVSKEYTVTVIKELDPVLDVVHFRSGDSVGAGIATVRIYEDTPTGISMRVSGDSNNAAPTGSESGNTDKVNTTGEWFGVGSQAIGADSALILQFAQNGSWNPTTGLPTGGFESVSLNTLSFGTNSLSSSEHLQWVVYDANGLVIPEASITWTVLRYDGYAIDPTTGVATGTGTPTILTVANGGITINTVTADGLTLSGWDILGEGGSGASNTGYYVLTSDVEFSKIAIEAGASSTFDIGYIDIATVKGTFDITTTVDIAAIDGDGDTTAAETVSLTFSNDATLTGTPDNDVIQGNSDANIITGGLGNDILTGDGGADSFVWKSGDTGSDIVTDFTQAQAGEVLDVSELVQADGLLMTAVEVDGHLQLQFKAGSTVVQTIDLTNQSVADNTAAQNLMESLVLANKIID